MSADCSLRLRESRFGVLFLDELSQPRRWWFRLGIELTWSQQPIRATDWSHFGLSERTLCSGLQRQGWQSGPFDLWNPTCYRRREWLLLVLLLLPQVRCFTEALFFLHEFDDGNNSCCSKTSDTSSRYLWQNMTWISSKSGNLPIPKTWPELGNRLKSLSRLSTLTKYSSTLHRPGTPRHLLVSLKRAPFCTSSSRALIIWTCFRYRWRQVHFFFGNMLHSSGLCHSSRPAYKDSTNNKNYSTINWVTRLQLQNCMWLDKHAKRTMQLDCCERWTS